MNTPQAPRHAMVLAAGLGTRMRPLTLHMPKPLVPVAGKPLLSYVLHPLLRASLTRIVINAHHCADQMLAYVKNLNNPILHLSDESAQLMDSGGGVKKALPLLGQDPFYCLNADSFWIDGHQNNLSILAQHWCPQSMDILLLLATMPQATGYDGAGDFDKDQQGRLTFRGDKDKAPFIYAGCSILKPTLFDNTPETPFSLSTLFQKAEAQGRLFGIQLDGLWMHVGTVAAIADTETQMRIHASSSSL